MKRSDAVKLIFKALTELNVSHVDEQVSLEQAHSVMLVLEKAGLLPQNPIGTNWYGSWEKEN